MSSSDSEPPQEVSHLALLRHRSQLLRQRVQVLLDRLQHRLAHLDALPQLTLLGLITGLAAAGLIVAFRLTVDLPLGWSLGGNPEHFESLPRHWYFLLPLCGGVLLAIFMQITPASSRSVSVGHVIERLQNHHGRLPTRNWLTQFVGGSIALLTGQSMGREGPAVHLGAGAASQLGQWLHLPNNCQRTLIGCGVASAIAASFNTPMAGMIFSMEVILMEYTVAGFIPVMMAAVIGAVISRLVFGDDPAFIVAPVHMNDLWELIFIVLSGLVVALFAAMFIRLQLACLRLKERPVWLRMLMAGAFTGALALYFPQILGVGYDTIESAMLGDIGLQLLLGILCAKVLASAVSGGLGVPGGVIGPVLFVGATLGGCLGIIISAITPDSGANPSFYVLLGMGAMMAAVINAPLAALITVFELTHNPNTIFPTMLIIVIAVITTRQLFRCEGLFKAQLEASGFAMKEGPVQQALNRVGVRSVMDTQFQRCDHLQSLPQLKQLLTLQPKWLVVTHPDKGQYLLPAADVAAYIATQTESDAPLPVLDIPGRQWQLKPIDHQASLLEAQQILASHKADALAVERPGRPWLNPLIGVITQDHIQNYYQL